MSSRFWLVVSCLYFVQTGCLFAGHGDRFLDYNPDLSVHASLTFKRADVEKLATDLLS